MFTYIIHALKAGFPQFRVTVWLHFVSLYIFIIIFNVYILQLLFVELFRLLYRKLSNQYLVLFVNHLGYVCLQ